MKSFANAFFSTLAALSSFTASAQPLNNPKNVDRTATSLFDGVQTFRALEHTTTPDPQSQKIYRLQTLPENGFPGITLTGNDNGSVVFFEDKTPYDNMFTDNPTPYLSAEAVQLHNGFQKVMKIFDQRFNWKGMDGAGTTPVKVFIENSDGTPANYSYAHYSADMSDKYFAFGRSIQNSTPLLGSVDIIAHEFSHAVMQHRNNVAYVTDVCSEYRAIDEGLANVFGIYIKNKILQSTPQNYNWKMGESVFSKPFDIRDPKSYNSPDTYKGQHYVNICSNFYDINGRSGIIGKWFYLLSSGLAGTAINDLGYQYGNLAGIGVEKAIQIIWNAIPDLKNYSTYPSLRQITLKAAEQLYGLNSTEYKATEKTWCAVGVCDNNLPDFSLYPANATSGAEPWPGIHVSLSWNNDDRVKEWEVQLSTRYDFTENLQTITLNQFDLAFKPGGGIVYIGKLTGYYHPGETVYARAKITQADANFCKGLNPLCQLYQQFSPVHAFVLNGKRTQFWHAVPKAGFTVNAWKDPTITWKPVAGAEKYTYQVANDKNFTSLIYTGSTNFTGTFPESGIIKTALEPNKKLYVRVRAERNNSAKLSDNFGEWSATDSLKAFIPPTSVIQALNQQINDPASPIASLGFEVEWYPVPGSGSFEVQVASDNLFSNIIHSQTAAGNTTKAIVPLPDLPDQTALFTRVIPKKNNVSSTCTNVWRIKTNQDLSAPTMTLPVNGSPIQYKEYLGVTFNWSSTVNIGLIDHFELHLTEKSSNSTTIYTPPGKPLDLYIKDQLMFDDKQGIQVKVLAVNSLGTKSIFSQPFDYPICPDQPFPKFPSDIDKIDPSKQFTITWEPSQWLKPGDKYLVSLTEGANPVSGFNNAQTVATSMVVPAGTLAGNKTYTMTIKNSGSCPGINAPTTFVKTVAGGNNNPPATPVKNLDIKLLAFRNDLDPANPFSFETSDYVLSVELFDPNGAKINIVDGNGNPVTQLLVDSENSILAMMANQVPVGKYILRLKMLNIFNTIEYYPFDQPRFSVQLNGQSIISNHIITVDVINPASPFNEWQIGFQFADIILDLK